MVIPSWSTFARRVRTCAIVIGAVGLVSIPALGNCIAHQPPNMRFTPPAGLQMTWTCVTAGPLYEHERSWYIITFKVRNDGAVRTEALKMQADVVDAFGDDLLSVPIVENARLATGDTDGAVFAFHPPFVPSSVDHVNLHVLAVRFADGSVWKNSSPAPTSGATPPPRAALQRFSMRWDSYDIGSVIAPSPSPSPSPSPR